MSLSILPSELLEAIAQELPSESHVNSLVRVNRRFYHVLNRHLYRRNDAERKMRAGNALYWAARVGRAETILRAEALGIAVPAPSLIAEATICGELGIVKLLFKRVRGDGDPAPDLDNPTALTLALENGHFEIFRFFVQEGADLEARGYQENTALHTAAWKFDVKAAELLLERGANIEATNEDGRTPLHLACQHDDPAAAQLFMAHSANLHARDNELYTPLHLATEQGNIGAVKMLLERGADTGILDYYEWTPLLIAIESGQPDVAILLIESGADLSVKGNGGYMLLLSALTYRQADIVRLLARLGADLVARDEEGTTLLVREAGMNVSAMVQMLLEVGVDADVHGRDGWTAPHEDVVCDYVEAMRVLLENRADSSIPVLLDSTVWHGNTDVVQALLDFGAEAVGTPAGLWPLLTLAAHGGLVEIGRLLLESGADAGVVAPDGRTAVEVAADRGHDTFVSMLRERGAVF